ncbi:hypothetical protein ACFL5O_10340, partial [Myxococcota bacterium]
MRRRLLGLVLAVGSCGDMEPCNGIKVGDRILITIQGPAPNPRGECNSELGLVAAQQLVATVEELGGDDICLSGMGAFEPVNGWEWQRVSDKRHAPGSYMLDAEYAAHRDACSGKISIRLLSERDLTATPAAARRLTFEYWPQGDPTGCPAFCSTDL